MMISDALMGFGISLGLFGQFEDTDQTSIRTYSLRAVPMTGHASMFGWKLSVLEGGIAYIAFCTDLSF
jgi:hypothetical protein